MKSVIHIFFSILLTITFKIYAQDNEPKLNHIGQESGLSQSTIYAIVQDARGFMWFGSQDGLNCFDGYTIKVYKHKASGINSLSDDAISCLLSDPPDNLWIGTFKGGLNRYSLREDKFYHYNSNDSLPGTINSSRINVLFRDSKGNIWAGTNEGLERYDNKSDTFIHYYSGKNSASSILKHINAVCEDKENIIWAGSRNGLFKLPLKKALQNYRFDQVESPEGNLFTDPVSSAYADEDGNLWIGLENSTLLRYHKRRNKFTKYNESVKGVRPIAGKNGSVLFGSLYTPGLRILNSRTGYLSMLTNTQNDLVNAVFIDNSDIIWIGTYFHGVYSFDQRNNRFSHYLNNPQNPDVVMSILEDKESGLWFGTFGNGIKYFNKNSNRPEIFLNDPGNSNSISSNKVLALESDTEGKVWIGTIGGGLDHYDPRPKEIIHYKQKTSSNPNGLSSNNVTALYKDHNGDLWIGHYSGQIDLYNHETGKFIQKISESSGINYLPDATVTIFKEDEAGNLWIGTHGNGLISYEFSTGSFTNHSIRIFSSKANSDEIHRMPDTESHNQANNYSLAGKQVKGISTLCITSPETIWLGSDESGLIQYNPHTDSSIVYSFMNDKTEYTIYGILPDSSGNLWLSTNNGLLRFDPVSGGYRVYDKYDGLQADEFNQGAYFKNEKGELFFGGINGVSSFFPSGIKDNEHIPPVYITSFKVFDKDIPLSGAITSAKKIELSYSQNYFSFEFVALNYTLPEKNEYAYILKGFDRDWHTVSARQRFASYTNLDPGEYYLIVKASNNDGLWNNKGIELTIVIHPPFWMTWWFRSLFFIFVISVVYVLYRYRMVQVLKMERMRLRIATDLHDELGSDLSAIALASQMTKGQDQNDQNRLNKIRENSLRAIDSMREIVWFIKPEHDTPEKLIDKMKEAAAVMLEGKKYNFVIRNNPIHYFQDIEGRQNLFLIFKETLTNIVRHSHCTEVQIELGSADGTRLLFVTDNGVGFQPEKIKRGSGLNSLKIRAARLNMSIRIHSTAGLGTTVELFQKNDAYTS